VYPIKLCANFMNEDNRALEIHLKTLETSEEKGDLAGISRSCNLIGMLHQKRGDYDAALESSLRALEIAEKIGTSPRSPPVIRI